jgi:hypothetical protein
MHGLLRRKKAYQANIAKKIKADTEIRAAGVSRFFRGIRFYGQRAIKQMNRPGP